MEIIQEDLNMELNANDLINLVQKICKKYDDYQDRRSSQLNDIRMVRHAIYDLEVPAVNAWDSKMTLPNIYELAQTLKSHICQNLYAYPDAMFDVVGTTLQSQSFAKRQKAMLVNTFEQMNIQDEIDKIVDSVIETGEATLFVGWETKLKQVRRAQTFEEQLQAKNDSAFVVEEKVVYDNAKVRHIKAEDFVFDKLNADNWDSCAKIYRTYKTIEEIVADTSNNFLSEAKLEILKGVVAKKQKFELDKAVKDNKVEILEYWGDIEL